jgi:hypothetical protein
MNKTKKIKGWAVILDGDIPDVKVGHLGNLYHICSDQKSAIDFSKECNDELIKVLPCEIIIKIK